MNIGLGTYALAWSIGVPSNMPEKPMDIFGFLQFAANHGFELVQIADNLPLIHFSKAELQDIKSHASHHNITIEVGTRGLMVENIIEHIRIARALGAHLLRIVIDQQGYEPKLSEIHAILRQVIPELEQSNIRLAIENHDRFKAREFREIIDQAYSSFVGICLDPANSLGADEGFETVFEMLRPVTINFHLKDYTIRRKPHMMGFDIVGTPAGQGRLPIRHVVNMLESIGRCHSMILELWPPPEADIESTIKKEHEWVQESARYLFEHFN
ncbi:MAG: sugar phosphate isomerase/epimerase family protein [Cyclobacteriaceae bacterium]|nr:sugar phosphate isomerase/epimerase family protein [Cyclobacteriaceae bacterium]